MSYSYLTYRVAWSHEDGEYVGLCVEYPSLSWLAKAPEAVLAGVQKMVADVVADMRSNGPNELELRSPTPHV